MLVVEGRVVVLARALGIEPPQDDSAATRTLLACADALLATVEADGLRSTITLTGGDDADRAMPATITDAGGAVQRITY